MKKQNLYNRGFGPLVIVIIVAIVAAAGAGTYTVIKKNNAKSAAETEVKAETDANANTQVNANASTTVKVNANGTLRALIALGKDTVCTVHTEVSTGKSEGTVYISGDNMRGDFTTTGTAAGAIESHMVKTGATMYAWSGSQGAKMDANMQSGAQAGASNGGVDLDQGYGYECKDWKKDTSKFVVPISVNFIDLSAMMNANGTMKMPAGVKVDASGKVQTGY